MSDPLPLSRRQSLALLRATTRQLTGGLQAVSRELRRWRRHAEAIPDPRLRADALQALTRKRGHTDGAALFWTLPGRRNPRLLRALVTYELIQDYLDTTSERAAIDGRDNSQLYLALADAVDPQRPLSDHYRDHPESEDAGYLRALIESFRADGTRLPSFEAIRPHLQREAARATVLTANHLTDPARRDATLRAWVEAELPGGSPLRWHELTAAASGWITTHALLALAAEPGVGEDRVDATYAAYFPWVALSLTLLDSYVDQAEDARAGDHNYFSHYADREEGIERLCESLERSAEAVLRLPDGERHAVLIACMTALYLSKDSARVPELRRRTREIARTGGTLPSVLMPVLRTWRVCNAQSAAT